MLPLSWTESVKHFFDFEARRREKYRHWDYLAENGDQEARYKLLALYQDGEEEYYPLAFKWTIAVANQGEDGGVMLQAAEMYAAGDGTPQDESRALLWYERALSYHIMLGRNSPFSLDTSNYLQKRIKDLREKLHQF